MDGLFGPRNEADSQFVYFQNTVIDFSGGTIDENGVVCVEIEEERNVIEQETEQQCTQQNVTQCFNDYITEYRDEVREKCDDHFVKTCRIVMRPKSYDHTTRVCRQSTRRNSPEQKC